MDKTENQIRKKRMMVLGALIIFCVWFLILVSINHARAEVGICEDTTANDRAILSIPISYKIVEGGTAYYAEVARVQAEGYNQGQTRAWIMGGIVLFDIFANISGQKKGVFWDYYNSGIVGDGCTPEGNLEKKNIQMLIYLLYGIFAAWAFVIGIHTVNS